MTLSPVVFVCHRPIGYSVKMVVGFACFGLLESLVLGVWGFGASGATAKQSKASLWVVFLGFSRVRRGRQRMGVSQPDG